MKRISCVYGDGNGKCSFMNKKCSLALFIEASGEYGFFCSRANKRVQIVEKGPSEIVDLDARAQARTAQEASFSAEELCGRFDLLRVDNGSVNQAVVDFFQKLYLKARSLVHDIPGAAEEEKNEIAIRMAKRALHRNLALAERKAIGEA